MSKVSKSECKHNFCLIARNLVVAPLWQNYFREQQIQHYLLRSRAGGSCLRRKTSLFGVLTSISAQRNEGGKQWGKGNTYSIFKIHILSILLKHFQFLTVFFVGLWSIFLGCQRGFVYDVNSKPYSLWQAEQLSVGLNTTQQNWLKCDSNTPKCVWSHKKNPLPPKKMQ